jgi:hypothetical protein
LTLRTWQDGDGVQSTQENMMSLRITSILLSSSLLSVVALAGCAESGASSEETSFADATPAQLERVYSASAGHDLGSALILGAVFSGENDTGGCPAIVTQGQDTTVTGGCTMEDGGRVDGSIAIHNLNGFEENPAYDPAEPGFVKLDFHVTTSQGERIDLDGRVDFNGRVELDGVRVQGDLTIGAGGVGSTSRLTLSCVDGTCTILPGSEIELSDLGGGSVEGTWGTGASSGRVTVRGADVLVIDIAGQDEKQCAPYEIGAKRGIVCPRDVLDLIFSGGFELPLRSAKR